jgi:hypothetical protein
VRIRQIALVARELEPCVETICDVLGVEVAYRDPGVEVFGLVNAVMPLSDTFLEVVSPTRPDASAARYLERRGGDGGYMVILQTEDLAKDRRRVEELGVRIVWEVELEDAASIHLHPRDVGGAILSLDAMKPAESWRWAGRDWRSHVRTDVVGGIVGVELEAGDPAPLAGRWSGILARAETAGPAGAHRIELDGSAVRFVKASGRGEGLSALVIEAVDPGRILERGRARGLETTDRSVQIAGTRFELVAS